MTSPKRKHHKEARQKDQNAKQEMKRRYDLKHRTKEVKICPGDWAYVKNIKPSTTKSPWEPTPFLITKVVFNRITGKRRGEERTRDRSDWKLLVKRPAHLKAYTMMEEEVKLATPLNTETWEETWNDDDTPEEPARVTTRTAAARQREQQRQQPRDAPPAPRPPPPLPRRAARLR